MSVWDRYENYMTARGRTKREAHKNIEKARLWRDLPDNLSYKDILLNGEPQNVAITDTDDDSIKNIHSMPDEHLVHGGLVDWEESKWLITSLDAHNELYDSGTLTRCNHLLKWRDSNGDVQERWCIVQDGTKLVHVICMYLFGMLETACKNYSLNCWDTLRALQTTA